MSERGTSFPYRRVRPFLRIGVLGSLVIMAITFYATLMGLGLIFLKVPANMFPQILQHPFRSGLTCLLSIISTVCFVLLDDKAEKTMKTAAE